jgi:hypothetical protein
MIDFNTWKLTMVFAGRLNKIAVYSKYLAIAPIRLVFSFCIKG